jgi:hypothetical protein
LKGTLRAILKQARIDPDDFLKADRSLHSGVHTCAVAAHIPHT